ncbi:MAG: GldG family protein [Vicinamibacteria bacterium]|nr:GldG family protein [Vicinamibacteria bacterium]
MKRFIDFLAPLGVVLILATLFMSKTLPGKADAYWIAGLALVIAHIVLRWKTIMRLIGRRQLRYGGNMIVLGLVVLAIITGVNYIVARRSINWDLTKGRRHTLSDQTRKIVRGLSEDVKITYFQRSDQSDLESAQDRLRRYQDLSAKIKVEYVDPVKKPALAERHDVRQLPVLVIEHGTNIEKITNDSEESLTNALIKVTRSKKKTMCFVEGEGARDIDDFSERGLSQAKTALEKSQFDTKKVFLLREKKVPEECTVLAVAGPRNDLLPPAIDAIRDFVGNAGKALVMLEPEFEGSFPNLTALLAEWRIETAKDVVIDVSGIGQFFNLGELAPLASDYPHHEITKDFRSNTGLITTAFPTVRSMSASSASVEGVNAQNLVETSSASWAESDLTLTKPRPDKDKDKMGPVSLGVAVTIKAPSAEPSPSPEAKDENAGVESEKNPEGRVVAFGDVDFSSNAFLNIQGNKDLFLNTVAWLSQDVDLISIRPKEPDDQRLFLTRSQSWMASILALVILPGMFIALGVIVWWRRR